MVFKIKNNENEFVILGLVLFFCIIGLFVSGLSVTGKVVSVSSWCGGADLNLDGFVNSEDLEIFNKNFGKGGCGLESWCEGCDIDKNGFVDIKDFDIFSSNYGKTNCFVSNIDCIPDFVYEEWSECDVDYRFEDLLNGVEELKGRQSRSYSDRNNCVESSIEVRVCSVDLEIYAEKIRWCEEDYYGIYEKNSGKLLSRIKDNKQESIPSLDVVFNQEVDESCGVEEKPLPGLEVEDYSLIWKLGFLVLFLGFVIVYFLVSRNLKKQEKLSYAFKPLKNSVISEREELFG